MVHLKALYCDRSYRHDQQRASVAPHHLTYLPFAFLNLINPLISIIYGFTGLVDAIIKRTEQEVNEKLTVVATGGLSPVIAPLTKHIKTIEPLLTLDGLTLVHDYCS